MYLVSIIMPYYKKRDYIKKSINSVLNQTYQNFEIIIVYDDQDLGDFQFINNIKKLLMLERVFQEILELNMLEVITLLF